jgi:hypothetical protein
LLPGNNRISQIFIKEQARFCQRTAEQVIDRGTTYKSDCHQVTAEKVIWLLRKQSKSACYQGAVEQVFLLPGINKQVRLPPGNSRKSHTGTKEQQSKSACYQGTTERVRLLQGNSGTSQIDTKEQQSKSDCYQGTAEQVR